MLGWGLMSSRALSMDRDPPLLVGLHRTSLDNTSTSCTEITQCNPISWPTQMPSGVGGHRESSGKRCSHARREQMSGSAAMHVGALQEAKRIWKAASCMKAQEQPKALVLLMGVRDMHGADPSGDPQPDGSIWSHTAPMPTASAKPHTLCGLHFQHSIAIATAEPPAQQAQGQRSCGRSSWEGQCTMPGSSRSQSCCPISPWRVQHQEGSAIHSVRSLSLSARTCLQF